MSHRFVFVVGTTASGKSNASLIAAKAHQGVIFNCDSIQTYQSVHIGSAQPSDEEKKIVPHYLFAYVKEGEELTAGQYSRDFYNQVEKIPSGVPIFVVGGTGFYFMAIEKGMYPVAVVSPEISESIEKEMQEEGGPEKLYEEFKRRDPQASLKIHPSDHYRLGRALELIRSEGKSLTEIQNQFNQQQKKFSDPLLKIGIYWEKEELQARIEQRTKLMLEQGLVEEVRDLLARGLESWAPLKSVGYKECVEFLRHNHSMQWLQSEILKNTMKLAKKQRTWFQRDKEIQWFHGKNQMNLMSEKVHQFLRS